MSVDVPVDEVPVLPLASSAMARIESLQSLISDYVPTKYRASALAVHIAVTSIGVVMRDRVANIHDLSVRSAPGRRS